MKTNTVSKSAAVRASLGLALAATVCAISQSAQAELPDVTGDYEIENVHVPAGLFPNGPLQTIFGVWMNDSGTITVQGNSVNQGANGSSQGVSAIRENGVWTAFNIPNVAWQWIGCGNPNASGWVPLVYGTADGNAHNALYHKGTYTLLPDMPLPSQLELQFINDDQMLTAVLYNPQDTTDLDYFGNPIAHGILTDSSLSFFKDISYPAPDDTYPYMLNNALQIVGQYIDSDGFFHCSVSDDGKTFVNIDPPGIAKPATPTSPGNGAGATGINNKGDICGYYFDVTTLAQQGFLLSKSQFSAFSVPQSEWTSLMCITDSGRLSGAYEDTSGIVYGFIATPKH